MLFVLCCDPPPKKMLACRKCQRIPTACCGDVETTFHMTCNLPYVMTWHLPRNIMICCDISPYVAWCCTVIVSHSCFTNVVWYFNDAKIWGICRASPLCCHGMSAIYDTKNINVFNHIENWDTPDEFNCKRDPPDLNQHHVNTFIAVPEMKIFLPKWDGKRDTFNVYNDWHFKTLLHSQVLVTQLILISLQTAQPNPSILLWGRPQPTQLQCHESNFTETTKSFAEC